MLWFEMYLRESVAFVNFYLSTNGGRFDQVVNGLTEIDCLILAQKQDNSSILG